MMSAAKINNGMDSRAKELMPPMSCWMMAVGCMVPRNPRIATVALRTIHMNIGKPSRRHPNMMISNTANIFLPPPLF